MNEEDPRIAFFQNIADTVTDVSKQTRLSLIQQIQEKINTMEKLERTSEQKDALRDKLRLADLADEMSKSGYNQALSDLNNYLEGLKND
jgi:hypothetical protein